MVTAVNGPIIRKQLQVSLHIRCGYKERNNKMKMKCPTCGSETIAIERRPNGDATCWECYYVGKPKEFYRKTNFDVIVENPEVLAEGMVSNNNGMWEFRLHNIAVIRTKSREAAVASAIEYLKQEVEQ